MGRNGADAAQKRNGVSPYYQQVPPGQASLMAQQALIQRNSSTHSPINAFDQQFSMHDYNLSTKNIAFNQINGRGLQINKYRDNGKNRATTSHASANPSLTHGNMQSTNYHSFGAANSA